MISRKCCCWSPRDSSGVLGWAWAARMRSTERKRVGPETRCPLQGAAHVGFAVRFQQRQHPLGLVLARAMGFQEPFQEAAGRRPQLREALRNWASRCFESSRGLCCGNSLR